ncbi:unnamed protein product [Rotaria sp. Silwood2]|nr:unnamed protein product [Rotaria sp. Silwood2]CAF2934772.1 unnamed protein product [Rotaria sp. Silwood2]CAF3344179.1 unnamed protein product [Rotaria sp. Silwood2]CAF4360617.1 unnamed protein product [Rotaria sp. Silwood2]CAF4427962.1 unnamed protein product [Rotaria sp. Silwood2]
MYSDDDEIVGDGDDDGANTSRKDKSDDISVEHKDLVLDISHPLESLTLSKQYQSITDLEEILRFTPSLTHLKIIGFRSFDSFLSESTMLEILIHRYLPLLNRFDILMHGDIETENFSPDSLMGSFQTLFWTEEKQWVFNCKLDSPYRYALYSMSMRTQSQPQLFEMDYYSHDDFDKLNIGRKDMNA